MESKKRRSSGEICMVDNAIQPLERPNANGGRHTDLRSGKIGTQLLSIALLLLMAALFVGPLWKRSRIETGGVAEVPGDALERHPIPILNNPEDNESWYLLNQHGRITSITLQGKTVNAGMTLEQLTDLLGKPSRFAVGDPNRDQCKIATYVIQSHCYCFYFDSPTSTFIDLIVINDGY